MQSGRKVCIYAKPQPLFAKLIKLQTLFAKSLEGYFLLFFTNRTMQSLFAKPLELLLRPTKDEITNTDNWKTCMYYSYNYHLKQKYISRTEIKPTSKRHSRYSSRCIHDLAKYSIRHKFSSFPLYPSNLHFRFSDASELLDRSARKFSDAYELLQRSAGQASLSPGLPGEASH